MTDNQSNRKGGIDFHTKGGNVDIGGDVIGRDKVTIFNFLGFGKRDPTAHLTPDYLARRRREYLPVAHKLWIERRLRDSLPERIRLELGMDALPEFAASYDVRYDHLRNGETVIDPHKPLSDLFAENGRALLILGAPGSGKTTTLLQIAEQLFEQAENDATAPIPIILNLSSWAIEQKQMARWIADELAKVGLMPDRAVTAAWLTQRHAVLLLDALDEVAETVRPACLETINSLRETGIDLVVSCREREFRALDALNISYAVKMRPFTQAEIVRHLARYPERDLDGIIAAVQADDSLWADLLNVPLTLTIAAVALDGVGSAELLSEDNATTARNRLFQRYTTRMLLRRPLTNYAPAKALHYLHSLAHNMNAHELTRFYIEWLQPTWLPSETRNIWGSIVRLYLAMFYALSAGASLAIGIEIIERDTYTGLIIGAFTFFLVGTMTFAGTPPITQITLEEVNVWKWNALKQWLKSDFKNHIFIAISHILPIGFKRTLIVSVIGTTIIGILTGLTTDWSNGQFFAISTFGVLAIIGLSATLAAIGFSVLINLLKEVVAARSISKLSSELRKTPNQGTLVTRTNSLVTAVTLGLSTFVMLVLTITPISIGFSIIMIIGDLINKRVISLSYFIEGFGVFLSYPLVFSLLIGFTNLGTSLKDVFAHYILRHLLTKTSILPHTIIDKKLIAFLDKMRDHIFLRRVGGGWEFIHRYIQDYFATLTPEEIAAIAAQVEAQTRRG